MTTKKVVNFLMKIKCIIRGNPGYAYGLKRWYLVTSSAELDMSPILLVTVPGRRRPRSW